MTELGRRPGVARRTALLGATGLAMLLAGCTVGGGDGGDDAATPTSGRSSTPGDTAGVSAPPGTGIERFYTQPLDWEDCSEDGDGFECATLVVPLDYADPDGDTITIAINRLPAIGRALGSLIVNPGGPGGSGLDYARGGETVASPDVLKRYDLVGFDPRGVGQSTPLDCIDDSQLDDFLSIDGSPDDATEAAALDQAAADFADACESNGGDLLPHLSTEDVARDLDVLRGALGDDKLTYLGKSYGTFIGATYADLFPDKVGHVVLDGAVDPAQDVKDASLDQGKGFDAALAAFAADCQTYSDCPIKGDVAAGVAKVGAFLDIVDATPIRVGSRDLTQALAILGIAVTLYDRENGWGLLRRALGEGFSGDGSTLMQLSDIYTDRNPDGTYASNADEVIYAVTCLDHGAQPDLAEVATWLPEFQAAAPIFGPYVAYGNLPCAHWPVAPVDQPHAIAATGAAPILVVGTTRDPATPYASAQALASELDSGVLLTYDGDGHTAYRKGSPCVDDAVDAYLISGTVPPAGTTC